MKLLFVTSTLSSGGTERVISLLANELFHRGHQVEIVCLNRRIVFYPIDEQVKVVFVEEEAGTSFIGKKMLWLRKYVKTTRPDAVLPFMTDVYSVTLVSLMGSGVPVISSERYDPRASDFLFKTIRWLFLRLTTHLVVQTEDIKSCYSKALQKRTTVIYNPVNEKVFEDSLVRKEKQNKIVSVGRLAPQKNFPMLINAFAKIKKEFPDFQLVIFGEGSLREDLQSQIDSLNLSESVLLAGRSNQVIEELRSAKLFCMSTNAEGMSNALIEAVCVGLPVITTNVSGAEELVDDGKTGFITPIGDETQLVIALRKMLGDEDLMKEMGERNMQKRDLFNLKTIANEWENVIKSVVYEKK